MAGATKTAAQLEAERRAEAAAKLDALEDAFNRLAIANQAMHAAFAKTAPDQNPTNQDRLAYNLEFNRNSNAENAFRKARASIAGNTEAATDDYIAQIAALSKQGKVATTEDIVNKDSKLTLATLIGNARGEAPRETEVARAPAPAPAETNPPVARTEPARTEPAAKPVAARKPAAKDENVAHTVEAGDTLSHIALSPKMKAAYEEAKKAVAGLSADKHASKEIMDLAMVATAKKNGIVDLNKIKVGQTIVMPTPEDIQNALTELQAAGKVENGHLALGKKDTIVAEILAPKTTPATVVTEGRAERSV